MRRSPWAGYIILFIGISILFGILGLGNFVGPLLFAGIGLYFMQKRHRLISVIFFAISLVTLFENVFHISVGGLIVAAFFIYIGYRMVMGRELPGWLDRRRHRRRRRWEKERRREERHRERMNDEEEDWLDEEIEKLKRERERTEEPKFSEKQHEPEGDGEVRFKTPRFRNSFIGDFHLMNNRFELDDMNISYGIGDVKIDLSKAIIPEGESTIVISGLIGDVDIYVPYDLDVSVNASATFGELKVLGYKQGGVNRQINLSTKGYEDASRRIKISISTFIGDVDVRLL